MESSSTNFKLRHYLECNEALSTRIIAIEAHNCPNKLFSNSFDEKVDSIGVVLVVCASLCLESFIYVAFYESYYRFTFQRLLWTEKIACLYSPLFWAVYDIHLRSVVLNPLPYYTRRLLQSSFVRTTCVARHDASSMGRLRWPRRPRVNPVSDLDLKPLADGGK